jgi:hypothetical protein
MSNITTAAFAGITPAAPGSAILGTLAPNASYMGGASNQFDALLSRYESMMIVCQRRGATGGTLDIYIQVSLDEGATWIDIGHYSQLAAGAGQVTDVITFTRFQGTIAPVVTGDAVMPANTFVQGEFTNRLQFKAVAGAGTSAGAAYSIKVLLNSVANG